MTKRERRVFLNVSISTCTGTKAGLENHMHCNVGVQIPWVVAVTRYYQVSSRHPSDAETLPVCSLTGCEGSCIMDPGSVKLLPLEAVVR